MSPYPIFLGKIVEKLKYIYWSLMLIYQGFICDLVFFLLDLVKRINPDYTLFWICLNCDGVNPPARWRLEE